MVETDRQAVIVDGCRIPFLRSGTGYRHLMACDLAAANIECLLRKTGLPGDVVDVMLAEYGADAARLADLRQKLGLLFEQQRVQRLQQRYGFSFPQA